MQIWIYLNGIQQGPYTLDQLRTMALDGATPVWYEGLAQWTPASAAPLTAQLFAQPQWTEVTGTSTTQSQPQGQWQHQPEQADPKKPATYLVWNIILTVLCCNIFALIGIITGAISSSRFASGDYEGAKRMSHATEWLLILAIVWLIVGAPIMMAFSLL